MAVKFLDGITVNSGSGSAATVIAEGTRPVTITGGAIGSVAIKGSAGGWATGYFFTGSSGTFRGGFGALGSVNNISYYFIGDAYNDTTMVVQPNAGNVGIGTTSPSKKLHVKESTTATYAAYIENTIAGGDYLAMIGDAGDNVFEFDSGGTGGEAQMKMYSDGVLKNLLDADGSSYFTGNVGIGTTSPSHPLSVVSSYPQIKIQQNGQTPYFTFGSGTGFAVFDGVGTSGGLLDIRDDGTSRMRIDTAGNVGIGTTAPAGNLQVAGGNPDIYFTSADTGQSDLYFGGVTTPTKGNIKYSDNADAFVFNVNTNTEAMRIISSGNVGIGTNSPGAKLDVLQETRISYAAGNQYRVRITDTDGNGRILVDGQESALIFGTSAATANATATEKMRISSAGNVGIGTTSPISQLHIKKASSPGPIIQLENAAGGSGADTLIRFGDSSENYSYSVGSDDSANSFRISYNGSSYNGAVPGTNDFLIFSTSGNAEIPNGDLKVTLGSIAVGNISNSATDGRIDASNDVVAFSTSDIRLKDNIKTIDKALDKVNSIQGIEFDWIEKEDVHGNSGHDIGVIAQEIEKILPDVVTTRDSGYKAVKYEKIVPLLIEAIKDLSKQVDGLKRLI